MSVPGAVVCFRRVLSRRKGRGKDSALLKPTGLPLRPTLPCGHVTRRGQYEHLGLLSLHLPAGQGSKVLHPPVTSGPDQAAH